MEQDELKKCGDCGNFLKTHFSYPGDEERAMPSMDEIYMACNATSPPVLLNRFRGPMGLTDSQSPFIKSCTHFDPKDQKQEEQKPEKEELKQEKKKAPVKNDKN